MYTVSLADETFKYEYLTEKEKILNTLGKFKSKRVAIDIETYPKRHYKGVRNSAFYPKTSMIRTIQLYDGENCVVIDLGVHENSLILDGDFVYKLFDFLLSKVLIAHNALFESQHLLNIQDSYKIKGNLFIPCTMNMFRLFIQAYTFEYKGYKASLYDLAKYFLKVELDKEKQVSDWSVSELTTKQLDYCALDAIVPFKLFPKLLSNLESYGLCDIFSLNTEAQNPTAKMMLEGCKIDADLHKELSDEWRDAHDKYKRELTIFLNKDKLDNYHTVWDEQVMSKVVKKYQPVVRELFIDEVEKEYLHDIDYLDKLCNKAIELQDNVEQFVTCTKDPAKEARGYVRAFTRVHKNIIKEYLINVGSSKQVSDWLKANLNQEYISDWEVSEKSGDLKLDKQTLAEKSNEIPDLKPFKLYADYAKLDSTYGYGMRGSLFQIKGGDIYMFPSYKMCFTQTGRFSSADPNIQNLPSRGTGLRFKEAVIPSKEDRSFICADYGGMELRCIAEIAQDKKMLQAFSDGLDLHAETAKAIFPEFSSLDKDSDEYSQLRTLTKNLNFGKVYGIGAKSFARNAGISIDEATKYMKALSNLYKDIAVWSNTQAAECEKSCSVTTLVGKTIALNPDKTYTKGLNHPVQGTAAEVLLYALVKSHNNLRDADLDAFLSITVHDEIVVDCHDSCIEQATEILVQSMEDAMLEIFPNATKTKLVEYAVGKNWKQAK